MMTRNQKDFWKFWTLSLFIAAAASVHRQTYRYVESSLGALWHAKLTRIFHRLYFRKMNYYALSQGPPLPLLSLPSNALAGAANRSDSSIPDVVERLTSDVKDVTQQASFLPSLSCSFHTFCITSSR